MNRQVFAPLVVAASLMLGSVLFIGCAGAGSGTPARPAGLNFYVEAVQAYNAGQDDRAVVLLLEAVRQNPDLRMARLMLADLYRARGDYGSALPNYERLTKLDPYTAENHYKLGVSYQFLNRLKEAAAAYLRALQLDPKDWRSNMNLGLVYLSLNQLDDSVTYLERASQLAPDNAQIWSNLGVALDSRGSVVLAEAAYKKAMELDPKLDTTLLNLGSNLVSQGKPQDALVVMEQALQRVQTPSARKRYADALALNGRLEDAVRQYDAAISADGRFWPAYADKGFALIRLYQKGMELDETQRDAAVAAWKKSLQLNPAQPRVRTALEQQAPGAKRR